jgi:hypothetical protein
MTAVRPEALLSGIEEMMKLHRACISAIESMLPSVDEGSVGEWRLFAKTLNRHWRCWGERAAELRQQVFGIPKTVAEDSLTHPGALPGKPNASGQLEALLEQHRLQYSNLDSNAAASRDYRTMCLARTQLAEALAYEQKLGANTGEWPGLRLAS